MKDRREFLKLVGASLLAPAFVQITRGSSDADRSAQQKTAARSDEPYVVAQPCIDTKKSQGDPNQKSPKGQCNYNCLYVCPVNAMDPALGGPALLGTKMVYIDPDVCISCGVCQPECPSEAIFEKNELPKKWEKFIKKNEDHFKLLT